MRSLVAFMVVGLMATSVSAQPVTGSRLTGPSGAMVTSVGVPSYDDARPTDEAVLVARGVAQCVVAHKREDAGKYLMSQDEASQRKSYDRFSGMMPACMEKVRPQYSKLELSAASFRSALAEALLANQTLPALSNIEPSKSGVPYWLSADPNQRVVQEMAICLADRHPQQSAALIQSTPGSAAEAAGFAALQPTMGSCLISGTTLHANRTGIRLALADAVYHRVNDPVDAPSQEKK